MSKHNRPFLFKRFSVEHNHSSMKVGIDAVILGAWSRVPPTAVNVLDVGCGCGVISMMIAQRFPKVLIKAIDIDEESVKECRYNFKLCEWRDRLNAELRNFNDVTDKFDYIISNPPYFEDGLKQFDSSRLIARHQGDLSPLELLKRGELLLNDNGKIGLVLPYNQLESLLSYTENSKLKPCRILNIAGRPGLEFKRSFLELEKNTPNKSDERDDCVCTNEILFIESRNGEYSDEYKILCKDFYLKF